MSLLLPLLLALPAFAEPCPNFRLDQGGSMARMPVYDQGEVNVCASYTAMQMIQAWRISQGERDAQPPSAFGIAFIYSAFRRENGELRPRGGVDGGNTEWAIHTLKEQGKVCRHDDMERHLVRASRAPKTLEMLLRFGERHRHARGPRAKRTVEEAARLFLRQQGHTPRQLERLNLGEALAAQPPPLLYHRIAESMCQGRELSTRKLPELRELHVHRSGSADTRESDLARYLKQMFAGPNPQPVGIGYCMDFLENARNTRNLTTHPSRDRPGAVEGCEGEHASVVIGSRERNGVCEFLIRNTYGSRCSGYDRSWQCENGQIWVTESALVRNVNQAAWFGGPVPR